VGLERTITESLTLKPGIREHNRRKSGHRVDSVGSLGLTRIRHCRSIALRLCNKCTFSQSQGRIDCKRLRWRRCAENSAARVGSDTALGGRHCLS
jgi:hypothetical protein